MAKILIVDDDPRLQTLMQHLLASKGHDCSVAENGEDALKSAKEHAFDLVITDLRMRTMNGMELLKELKSLHPDVPVIMVTAYASDDTTFEAVKLGVFDYLEKPFRIADLVKVVNRALAAGIGKSRALDQYHGDNPVISEYLRGASSEV